MALIRLHSREILGVALAAEAWSASTEKSVKVGERQLRALKGGTEQVCCEGLSVLGDAGARARVAARNRVLGVPAEQVALLVLGARRVHGIRRGALPEALLGEAGLLVARAALLPVAAVLRTQRDPGVGTSDGCELRNKQP